MGGEAKTNLSNSSRVCSECKRPIFADAPLGLCSLCVFKTVLRLLEEDDKRIESPPASRSLPKQFDDYELLDEIGRGGQGVVYRARQISLNRKVALKIIGIGSWATESHLRRFRLEAEAAARLNHSSIVPIHEIGEREDCCYYSMNLIEGGQLDEVVRRDGMSIRCAAELIAKLARTVHYAHEHGILHRDIKPGNILLDTKGEPYLTDFGLARLLETESNVTRTTEVLGTPSFMAPEQASAGNATLTNATDTYSLGAVFYSLLTGVPPFIGNTTYETIRQVLETEPRSPRSLNPKVDRDISTICLKCLEKDPARRYSSALLLAEDLEHWLRHEPVHARPVRFVARTQKWLRRNPAAAIAVTSLVALVAAIGALVLRAMPNESQSVINAKSIAVLPFENLSEDKANRYFADGVQDEILTRLSKIAALKVISRTSTQKYKSAPDNLREIGKKLGVAHIVEGSVQKIANAVHINVQLIRAIDDGHVWAESYDRKLDDIFVVEGEVAQKVAEALNTTLTGDEKQRLRQTPTRNAAAYEAYLRGLSLLREDTDAMIRGAIDAFDEAVRLDPQFALAWARLAEENALLYFYYDTTPARRATAERCVLKVEQLQPQLPETHLARAYFQYWGMRDYKGARALLLQLRLIWPGNADIIQALAWISARLGDWRGSNSYFEQATALNPHDLFLRTGAAFTRMDTRDFSGAQQLIDDALAIWPNEPSLLGLRALTFQATGALDEAQAAIDQLKDPADDIYAVGAISLQAKLRRQPAQALQFFEGQLARAKSNSEQETALWFIGEFQDLIGDTTAAQVTYSRLREMTEKRLQEQPENIDALSNLAVVLAALGDRDSALRNLEKATALGAGDARVAPALEELRIRMLIRFGEKDRALSALPSVLQAFYGSAGSVPLTPALLRLDPDFDPLRGDPRFEKIVASLAPE